MPPRRICYRELDHCGRLGNACWQVASSLGIARANGTDPLFPETWSYRPWFSLPDEWYGDRRELKRARPAQEFSNLPGVQPHYLQQHEYIKDVLPEIQTVLAPSPEASELLADHLATTGQSYLLDLAPDGITLHVRRGDNLDEATHPVGTWPTVTMEYYRAAVALFDPDAPLVIFSDDPGWCRANVAELVGPRLGCIFVVTDGPTRPPEYLPDGAYAAAPALDWIDLQLMAMFSRHIIAASTYSLWGAMLGPGPTVYPNNWCGDICREQVPEESSMVPPEWVMVDNPVPHEQLHPNG